MKHSPEERLLIAAYQEGARPGSVGQKCAMVIRRVLTDAGKWDDQAAADMYQSDGPSEFVALYRVLISMIGEGTMFVGQGNFRLPAAAPYTECRLTEGGEAAAKLLREEAP